MPVFGADPGTSAKEWWQDPNPMQQMRFVSPDIRELVTYFLYHVDSPMSSPVQENDEAILARLFRKRLSQGYTKKSLLSMIDRFYQSWAAEYTRQALMFTKNEVQETLLKEAELVKNDPVLNWLLMGMPDNGPFDDPKAMRVTVLLCAEESILRVPEYIRDALELEPDIGAEGVRHLVTWVESLLTTRLAGIRLSDTSAAGLDQWSRKHLAHVWKYFSTVPTANIRPRYPTVQRAIAAIPIKKKTVEW